MNDHFFARATRAGLPFIIWATHFAFSYIVAAAQCTPGAWRPGGPSPWILGGATVLALLACAWSGAVAGKRLRAGASDFMDYVAAASALMAFVAIAWMGIPMLLVSGCA